MKIEALRTILFKVWSLESSSKWTPDNPAKGQCGVTALVVHDLLLGEIFKTETEGSWHFYNVINGTIFDFTASQFTSPITYLNIPSNREEAFQDTNCAQYTYLKEHVLTLLNEEESPFEENCY
ncbi:hypothetical protein ACFSCX_10575 [Bacillus salitolerans]|uniref:YunG n=1 Tax=Bacillus salitolerans TaxID=1437434 RepID=A0ABW4LR73_9BACI